MKKYFVLLILVFSLCACTSPIAPTPPALGANMALDGEMQRNMTSDGHPQFAGHIKNVGTVIGYDVKIKIKCYSDTSKTTLIDTADGFPANLGDIGPGQQVYFEAVAFNCTSHDQIKAYVCIIMWGN